MRHSGPAEWIGRAQHLLWIIAMCDVENLSEQRRRVLCQLRELEVQIFGFTPGDLYGEVLRSPEFSGSE